MTLIVFVRMPCSHYVRVSTLPRLPRILHDVGASLVDKVRVLPPGYT